MTNWKPVIRAAFELSDDDWELATKLRSLSEPERELLMNALGPPAKSVKKSSTTKKRDIQHCDACDYTKRHMIHKDQSRSNYHEFQPKKSARASGMAEQLSSRRQEQRKVNAGACTFVLEDGAVCNTGDNNPIHDKSFGYAGYHPFVAPVATAASKSSRKSEGESSIVSSGTPQAEDGVAVSAGG